MFALANAYNSVANTDKTKEIIKKILSKNPKHTSAHKLFGSIIDYRENKKHLSEMENIIRDKSLTNEQVIDLSFALGKAYEDIGNYEKSLMECIKQSTKNNWQIV